MEPIPLDNLEMSLLQQQETRLQALGQEQAFRQRLLDRVSIECAMVQRQIALMHNSRIAAISCLPEDILLEVFKSLHRSQSLLPGSTSNARDLKRHRVNKLWRAEIVLSSVCSRWRTTALGLRSLWSLFWCDKPSSCARLVDELARFRTYLQRSRTHSLELFFDFTCPEPYEPESTLSMTRFKELVQEMLGVAVGHAERWKQITILANDTRRRVPVTPLKADIWAPKLERMVVCTGEPSGMGQITEDEGWNSQVLLLGKGDRRGPCPALRYLKLDRAGLQSCRPCIARLTHLVLEYGSLGSDRGGSEFVIEWPALLDILRSPHLESLSLCEKILCRNTFPTSHRNPKYHLDFPTLIHLRLGSAFRRDGWGGPPSQLLWFLLRYIAAPHLETLEISSFIVGNSPWTEPSTDSWPILEDPEPTYQDTHLFPSLKSLALSDIKVSTQDKSGRLGFLLLERMTRNTEILVLSDHQSSLAPILSGAHPFNRDAELPFPEAELWPNALDISINFNIKGTDVRGCLGSVVAWCTRIRFNWKHVQVLRLPPIWVDMWLARLKQRIGMKAPPSTWSDFVWKDGQRAEAGSLLDREEEDDGVGPRPIATYGASICGHPVRIAPLEEVIQRCWPPGSESTPLNTLESEQFEPFNVEFGEVSVVGTVYG